MGKIPHTPEDHECLLFNSRFLGEGQYSPLEKGVRGLFLTKFFNAFHVNYNPLTPFSKGESWISIECANS
jgi:hypothetical protein